ncbi:MAG TPA: CDP-diacylglycerol--serine O-phosphatidyltransferase [Longimicrobiaceae bacterium]|nr:CDP-diacylglycerol--serine O-phosphatidyltransferase [Longimicrobiaceae bacterium]
MSTRARVRLQRGVVILPSAFTLGNLFLGIWAIVSASRGQFMLAGWLIVLAAVLDMLDGRVARFTRTGTDFGAELDSLVDAISFGVAPAMIMYFLFLSEGNWSWVVAFLYVTAAVLRLARFNVEQAGRAKTAFHGLPSPTAGVTLATFYAFSQTDLFQRHLAHLPWNQLTIGMILGLAVLMLSHVLYPVVPKFSFRSARGLLAVAAAVGSIIAAFTIPSLFFFPAAVTYIVYGLVRSAVLGFEERLSPEDPLIDEEDEDGVRELEYEEIAVPPRLHPGPRKHTSGDPRS